MSQNVKNDLIDIKTKFREAKSLDELEDLTNVGKGKTPEGIEQKCLHLCKEYLDGNWCQQTVDSIQVERITGGFVNQIYHCSIREPNDKEGVPQEVSIKLLMKNIIDLDKNRLKEYIIALKFSEYDLGPKIYGLFETGLIQEYYTHRTFKGEDQKNPILLRKVCQSLAKIHSLELPLRKDLGLFAMAENHLREGYEKDSINKYFKEHICKDLKEFDLKTEYNWIKSVIRRLECPVIFTHNDYRSSNLMITEPNDELVVCDFDSSGYGYRGNDFVWLMKEWGHTKQVELKTIEGLPLNDEFRPFIEIYVEECIKIHGKSYAENPINCVDHILKEAKVFLLSTYLYIPLILIKSIWSDDFNTIYSGNPKLMMEWLETNFKVYLMIKDIFEQQNIFT